MATTELLEPNMLLSPDIWAGFGHLLNPLRRPFKARVMTESCLHRDKFPLKRYFPQKTKECKTSSQNWSGRLLFFLTRERSPRSQAGHNLRSPFSSESPRRADSLWEANHAFQTEIGALSSQRATVSTDEQPFRKPLGRSKHPRHASPWKLFIQSFHKSTKAAAVLQMRDLSQGVMRTCCFCASYTARTVFSTEHSTSFCAGWEITTWRQT